MPIPYIIHKKAESQTLDEIRDWHQGIVDALVDQIAFVRHADQAGSAIMPRFAGMTEADLNALQDSRRRELGLLTMLNLVASAEATIRLDYFGRVENKLKDTLAVAYRKWHKSLSSKKRRRPDFDEDGVLYVLKQTGVVKKNIINQYRECLRARHWLGHGRYWAKPAEVDQLSPDEVYLRSQALLGALPT